MNGNAQIPVKTLFDIKWLLFKMSSDGLSEKDKQTHSEVMAFLEEKTSRLRNREAYKGYVRAHKDDKGAALQNYLATKELKF